MKLIFIEPKIDQHVFFFVYLFINGINVPTIVLSELDYSVIVEITNLSIQYVVNFFVSI